MISGTDSFICLIISLRKFQSYYHNILFILYSIHGNLRDALVEGLSEYTVNDAKFKLAGLKITLNITWPSIKIKSLYKLNAKFDEWEGFALFGKGDVRYTCLIQLSNSIN